MSDPTSLPVAVVADTIVRTVELGVTITDAAVDGDAVSAARRLNYRSIGSPPLPAAHILPRFTRAQAFVRVRYGVGLGRND